MEDTEARFEQLMARLRQAGHRITPQRVAIARILAASVGHPSVEQIYEQVRGTFPTTSIATVYKTVHLLKDMGEVLELEFGEGIHRYDGNRPYPHPHLVCIRCGSITDCECAVLDALPEQVAMGAGYRVLAHRLDIYGLCPACQSDDEAQLAKAAHMYDGATPAPTAERTRTGDREPS